MWIWRIIMYAKHQIWILILSKTLSHLQTQTDRGFDSIEIETDVHNLDQVRYALFRTVRKFALLKFIRTACVLLPKVPIIALYKPDMLRRGSRFEQCNVQLKIFRSTNILWFMFFK